MRALATGCVAVLAVLLVPAGAARADASLEAVGGGELRELSHELSLAFVGLAAEATTRTTWGNGAAHGQALARYTFELPAGAAITDVRVQLADGRRTVSAAIDAAAATRLLADPDAVDGEPDVALVRLVEAGEGEPSRFELRVSPVPAGRTVEVALDWMAPLSYRDGRLSLRVPGRGDAANLVREQVALTLRGAHRSVTVGGTRLAERTSGGRFRAAAPSAGDLVLQAVPGWRGGPQASFAVVPVADDFGVAAVSVVVPPALAASPRRFERVLIVADVSRSLGSAGLAASRALADELLRGVGGAAEVALVTFDRRAQRAIDWRGNDREARAELRRALTRATLDNGSDLGAGLDEAAALLAGDAPTLVAVLTDGVLPLALDGADAVQRLGAGAGTTVLGVAIAPEDAPVPERVPALAALAHATGGRLVTLRRDEVAVRAPGLLAELAAPPPLEALEVRLGGVELAGLDLPLVLPAGSGALALGVYRGPRPKQVTVVGERAGQPVALRARATRGAEAARQAALAVAASAPGDWIDGSHEHGRRRQTAAAAAVGATSQESALVAVAEGDRYGRARLALARRHGSASYRRLPPAPERAAGHAFRPFAHRVAGAADAERRRTGELDPAILQRLLRQYVLPRARACFERSLRGGRDLGGSVVLEVEIARGEVQHARVARAGFAVRPLAACVVEAAYQMQVPAVRRGDDPEAVSVVRYPLRFRRRAGAASVEAGSDAAPPPAGGTEDDPLGGLPDD